MPARRTILASLMSFFLLTAAAQGQEAVDTRVSVDPNATNASNDPLTPKIRLALQNYIMPMVQGQGGRWSNESQVRLYVPGRHSEHVSHLRAVRHRPNHYYLRVRLASIRYTKTLVRSAFC
jgi:hypothetical protein